MAGTLARECARHETTAFTSCEMLDACAAAGDLRRATQWCRVAEEFAARYGSPYLYVRCRVLYGAVLVRAGELARAEAELRAALEAADGAGPLWRAQVLAALAEVRLARGGLEEAEVLVERCAGHPAAAAAAAGVRLARGDAAGAAAVLERRCGPAVGRPADGMVSVAGSAAVPALALLVRARLDLGDVAGAAAAAACMEAGGEATLAAGRVALAAGDVAGAVDALERAVSRFVLDEDPLQAARARVELARALVSSRPQAAVAAARAALACLDAAGAGPDADAAAALLRALGVAGRTGPRGLGVLSEREQQVLRLVGLGLSNAEIAERLHISPKTASHHVSHVLTKLGVRNRAAAAAHAEAQRPVG
ncbi:helix-turn-helix transcriptional regulator [Pseudonocardia asaccharolytica]|uniref:HTH luxR-type domain-containing protein n=1 Tax=Pseudonocardia asaccharolytica DSM 44247 = NBRC 16224 TaxID=1123024 RepID=A0A511CWX2_9PSEU|nr:helix-turn-helix transcriptional regulator [Pseudonocardia asaccharolytica]GEL16753.1 hypothetical protein PA7_05900 [Pseudonocardia asaccharolytica DSM 44247 = NBRC 16224]